MERTIKKIALESMRGGNLIEEKPKTQQEKYPSEPKGYGGQVRRAQLTTMKGKAAYPLV